MKEKHNGVISIWKFIFACVIVLFHCNAYFAPKDRLFFTGGYIAVEFFFIVSGFFLAKNILKKNTEENIGTKSLTYIKKIFSKIIIYIFIAFILGLLVFSLKYKFNLSELINTIWNPLLLRQAGFQSRLICGQFWYIGSFLFALLLLCPLLFKYKENFIKIASPIIIVFGLGYLNHNWLGLDHAYEIWDGIWYTGTPRAIIELNIGMILYLLSEYLKKIDFTLIGKILITIIPHSLLLLVLYITQHVTNHKEYDYIMLLLITIAVLLLASGKTIGTKLLSNKLSFFLEKLSIPMFINHMFIIDYININKAAINLEVYQYYLLALAITILFSIIEMFIIFIIKKVRLNKLFLRIFVKTIN